MGQNRGWRARLTHAVQRLFHPGRRAREEHNRRELLSREREARKRTTVILESITDAFYTLDRDWRFIYVNGHAEELLRRPRERLVGRNIWDEFPEALETTGYREYHRAMDEGTTIEYEEFFAPLDAWFEVRAYPSPDVLSVYFHDVTERKRAEEELRESERNFRVLGNSIPQLAWMADPTGWIFWYNKRWYDYTGAKLGEMQGWGWRAVHHPDHVDRVVKKISHAFETGESWEDTFPLRSRTGEYRWFLSRAEPIKDADGRVIRWFGTNTDVTDRIEAAEERERLLEREQSARAESERRREALEQVTESRARLVRGFSHDVKNPLGAADGYLRLIDEGLVDQITGRQKETLEKVRRSIGTALDLIEDLLGLARAEAGELAVERAPTDVRAAAIEAVEEYRAAAEAEGIAMKVDLTQELPTIDTDSARIRQVLGNLLSNAVKYTDEGEISVGCQLREGGKAPGPGAWIAVAVTDTGPGISREQRGKLFQEFRRVGKAGKRRGAGIGLAISRRISESLGGTITVDSVAGRGSTFTLWLPVPSDVEQPPIAAD